MSEPAAPWRKVVVGNTASGRSTLAPRLAVHYAPVHLELDAFAHGPAWQLTSRQAFRDSIEMYIGDQDWVCDGNYLSRTSDWLWPRADWA